MRILFFSELYFPNISGGAEIFVQLLAENLVKVGHTVYICSIADSYKRSEKNGVNLIYLKYHNIYWEYQHSGNSIGKAIWHMIDMYNHFFRHDISLIISEVSPDIVHTNNICGFSSIVWTIAKERHIPLVHTIHDHYLMCYRTTMFHNNKVCESQCLSCRFASMFAKRGSQKVDAVVGVSQYILNKHLENRYFKNAKVTKVIGNGFVAHQRPKIEREKNVIGFIGSITPVKGVERLMDDFNRLGNNGWKLKIAGKGSDNYIAFLKRRYPDINVEFVGRVDPDEFLSSISLLVVPSLVNDTFGRVVVEAIFNNCPVIVSNRGGLPEIIKDKQYRFEPDDSDSLYHLLREFIDGRIVWNTVEIDNSYLIENVVKEYIKIYRDLMN